MKIDRYDILCRSYDLLMINIYYSIYLTFYTFFKMDYTFFYLYLYSLIQNNFNDSFSVHGT